MKAAVAVVWVFLFAVIINPKASAQSDPTLGASLYHNCKAAIQFMDGNTRTTDIEGAVCSSYIEGFTDSGVLSGAAATAYCFDDNTSNGVIIRLYVQYMEAHPKLMDRLKFVGLAQALHENYPCKQTTNK
jgi:hypothetical protein